MASLCREFGISRKTGYKIFERYEQCGLEGLSDRTRRPFRYANQLPEQVEAAIVAAKREKPHWGARKIRERLLRRLPHAIKVPAASTVHAVLDRHGLVNRMARPRTRAEGTPLSDRLQPNHLWCTDYKACCGRIFLHRKKINLSKSLAGQAIGIKGSRRRHLARQLYGL